jgi:hypothetical protein
MEQLKGRDPSGEVTVYLLNSGKERTGNEPSTTDMELSLSINRDLDIDLKLPTKELDTMEEQIGALEAMVEDLQSALQKLLDALKQNAVDDTPETLAVVFQAQADAMEISVRPKP